MMTLVPTEGVKLAVAQGKIQDAILNAAHLSDGYYDAQEILDKLTSGEFQLWFGHDTQLKLLMITGVEVWPRGKHLHIITLMGKEFDAYSKHLDELKVWAKSHGCVKITASVRQGMAKKLKPLGFVEKYVRVETPLEP